MDRLAACHLMHGFLHVPGSGRGHHHASAPACQHVKRSLSLADRRGLVSPARGNARGLISPPAAACSVARHGARAATGGAEDEWEGMARRMHGHSRMGTRMHDWGMLRMLMGPAGIGAAAMGAAPPMPLGFPPMGGTARRTRGRSAGSWRSATISSKQSTTQGPVLSRERAGQLLVSLQYMPSSGQLCVHVVRGTGLHQDPAPSLAVWLLRIDSDAVEKRQAPAAATRGASPVFDTYFSFSVKPSEMNRLAMVVMLMMDSSTELGHCVLGELAGVGEEGVRHYRETIARPDRCIAQWHTLSARW